MWSTLDHATVALERLLSQYRDKPRFIALIRALAAGVQQLEDDLDELVTLRTLDAATDAALDQYGAIVGEPRGGLADNDYRRFILVRILVNKSNGTLDELALILEMLFDVDILADIEHAEYFPMTTIYTVTDTVAVSTVIARRIWRDVLDAKAAGVRVEVVEATAAGGDLPFQFDGGAGTGFDEGVFARTLRGV